MSFDGQNIVIVDLETLHSAADLPTGWTDHVALGLSIGGYYDYQDGCVHWFDGHTLEETMGALIERQPMLVSFNGAQFDGPLMSAIVASSMEGYGKEEVAFLEAWRVLWEQGYDILAEIWRADAHNKYVRGLNSLDAILKANGLPPKTGSGELAPTLWQEGRIAEVIEYCQNDILRTKDVLELVARNKGRLQRSNGLLQIRHVCTTPMAGQAVPRIVMDCTEGTP